jgi:hypothetical protein
VEQFKYLKRSLTNQNSIHEEIKSGLKSGNDYYHSVQNLLSSSLLSKNIMIKTYTNIILSVVLYGCETCSVTLWDESRLKVFENMVLRRIFVLKRVEMTGECRKQHNEELNDLYFAPNIVQVIRSRRMRWAEYVECMWSVEVHTGFSVGNRTEKDYLEDPALLGRVILSWICKKWDEEHGLD